MHDEQELARPSDRWDRLFLLLISLGLMIPLAFAVRSVANSIEIYLGYFRLDSLWGIASTLITVLPGLYGLWRWWIWQRKSMLSTITAALAILILLVTPLLYLTTLVIKTYDKPLELKTEARLSLDRFVGTDYTITELSLTRDDNFVQYTSGPFDDSEYYMPVYCLRIEVDGMERDLWIQRVTTVSSESDVTRTEWIVIEGGDNASGMRSANCD